jgi:hypothetical protein
MELELNEKSMTVLALQGALSYCSPFLSNWVVAKGRAIVDSESFNKDSNKTALLGFMLYLNIISEMK